MKSLLPSLMLFAVLTLGFSATAQGVLSSAPGTPGELGAFAPAVDEVVVLPEDGILHYTTITIPVGVTVTFARPASGANPAAHLLATGDIVVDGTLNVSGEDGTSNEGGSGGPGGFVGGTPGNGVDVSPGAGQGPGGAAPCPMLRGICSGVFGGNPRNSSSQNGSVYGSGLLVPLIAGSGGGGGAKSSTSFSGGGGGGGALLLASETRIQMNGTLLARGGRGAYATGGDLCWDQPINHGSGGAIRLVAPIVEGSGSFDVTACRYSNDSYGGYGRIRFDAAIRTGMAFTHVGANGANVVKNGSYLVAIPPPAQGTLSLVSIGGFATNGEATTVQLPFGAPPTQDVVLNADGFATGLIDVTIRLTPASGVALETTVANIDVSASPTTLTLPVTFPLNTLVQVRVWAKQISPSN